ncbi:Vga family ABC-F type ribosomal protection protein [Oceanobacillus sp. J11TS1]|uniref:Vga family ABC-F type ribosomal protection protein n=1 Tax=Oceanobacillus sp. J11TS1 TaxID=2807191 RepID=UPI001B24DEF4|nr:ABC-F type ribosomal protection protein [Oceanobacillus sp. J11TS1]GIO23331.1 ABC-F type ribosomal protection protein [Oceanobacillus sp. J11TS1]
MKILEAHHIKHSIKDRELFSIEHLAVHSKDRIGLVGKNGSGKTTLLNLLAGNIRPEQGTVQMYTLVELLPQLKEKSDQKSGGEVTQAYIVEALKKQTGLLLADEPTTNLDTAHIEWLEKQLSHWQGAFIIVSHDRNFLDKLCKEIWEIDKGTITIYSGNYSAYRQQKEKEIEKQRLAYEHYQQKKQQLERAIEKKEQKAQRATKTPKSKIGSTEQSLKGTKPYFAKKQKKLQKTSKALETRLENLEKVEKVTEAVPIKMTLPHQERLQKKIILRIEDVEGTVPGKRLWKRASLNIKGGDKVGIIGPNGAGKTTFLKKIMQGEDGITLNPSVKIGYFRQDLSTLNTAKSILENVKETSKQDETLIRTVLARLHFYRDDVFKPVLVLSGGERVKVAFAKLFVSDINMLILDEPTNYLDIEAVEALESLLLAYEGTVLFVSHDRQFTRNIATKIIEINNQELVCFEGNLKQLHEEPTEKKAEENAIEQQLMIIETKITEVLSKLSLEPSDELDQEFQKLLQQKQALQSKKKK